MRKSRRVLSEMNVIPLVDVMLVLLIIFMISAPMLQQGIDVDLPEARGGDLSQEERVTVVIKKGGTIYMNDNPVSMAELTKRLSAISKLNPNVFLMADRDVPYGLVAQVMGEMKGAGIEKLGMVTEPKIILP